jgi:ferredoxin-NADP reductase
MQTIRLSEKIDIARGTRLFWFDKPEGFTFTAGQYTVLKLEHLFEPDLKGPVRSLSICSAPHDARLGFALRHTGSPFKDALFAMEPGQTGSITPPVGQFVLDPADSRPVVFIAGGIGITPVRSILTEAALTGSTRSFTLLYGNRTPEDVAFRDELRALKLASFQYVDVLESAGPSAGPGDERGMIDEALLRRYVDKPEGSVYYVVGSPSFNEAMRLMLGRLGIQADQVHFDAFTGLLSHREHTK